MIQGYVQEKEIDYQEISSPVTRYSTIRFLLVIAAKNGLNFTHMDIATTYLNSDSEDICSYICTISRRNKGYTEEK